MRTCAEVQSHIFAWLLEYVRTCVDKGDLWTHAAATCMQTYRSAAILTRPPPSTGIRMSTARTLLLVTFVILTWVEESRIV